MRWYLLAALLAVCLLALITRSQGTYGDGIRSWRSLSPSIRSGSRSSQSGSRSSQSRNRSSQSRSRSSSPAVRARRSGQKSDKSSKSKAGPSPSPIRISPVRSGVRSDVRSGVRSGHRSLRSRASQKSGKSQKSSKASSSSRVRAPSTGSRSRSSRARRSQKSVKSAKSSKSSRVRAPSTGSRSRSIRARGSQKSVKSAKSSKSSRVRAPSTGSRSRSIRARRSQKSSKSKSQKSSKGPKSQKSNKGPKSQKSNKGPKSQKSNKGPKSQKSNKGPKSQKSNKGPKSQKSNKGSKSQKSGPSSSPSQSCPKNPLDKGVTMHYYRLGRYNERRDGNYGTKKWKDADWESLALWRYIIHKWRSEVLVRRNSGRCSWWSKCTKNYWKKDCNKNVWNFNGDGSNNRFCHVCSGEDSEEECVKNGHWTECANGQDGCVVEVKGKPGCEKYFRRCGAVCECGFRDKNFTKQDELSCMHSTCAKEYNCLTYTCNNKMFGDFKNPNVGYYYNNGKLEKCRCDDWCYEPPYEGNKDPGYDYPCCPSNCDKPCLDNYNKVLTPTLSFNYMDLSFCNPPTTTSTTTTTTTTTTTMMPMMGGGGGD